MNINIILLVYGLPIITNVLDYRLAITSGLSKWMIVLSSLNMFTSSMPGIG